MKDAVATPKRTFESNRQIMALTTKKRFFVDQDGNTRGEINRQKVQTELADLGRRMLFHPMTKYKHIISLFVRLLYGGVFFVVERRTDAIIVSGRAGTFKRLQGGHALGFALDIRSDGIISWTRVRIENSDWSSPSRAHRQTFEQDRPAALPFPVKHGHTLCNSVTVQDVEQSKLEVDSMYATICAANHR